MNINTYEELKPLVKAEAENLKHYAISEELNKLDFELFNPFNMTRCIYGQLTGSCMSDRAQQLIKSCVQEATPYEAMPPRDSMIISTKCDGSQIAMSEYLTPIEKFITWKSPNQNINNKILIDYLKGETNELIFE